MKLFRLPFLIVSELLVYKRIDVNLGAIGNVRIIYVGLNSPRPQLSALHKRAGEQVDSSLSWHDREEGCLLQPEQFVLSHSG
jgi:hypothetical protein